MSQTMRALVKREAAQGIWMEDVPIPQAGTNEVLIKVEKTAICGTDVHIYNWDEIIFKSLELHGIYGRRMYETWYKMTQMVLTGFPLHKAMTHHIPIDEYETGFRLVKAGESGKIACDWTGDL